jgi:hypothetical protein
MTMTQEATSEEPIIVDDYDFVDERKPAAEELPPANEAPLPAKEATPPTIQEAPSGVRLHGKTLEMPLPDMAPSADSSAHDIIERFTKWRAAFLDAAQRNLHRLGMPGAQVTDFRSLKHWDISMYGKKDEKPPQTTKEDAVWAAVMKNFGKMFDRDLADDDDYIILVRYAKNQEEKVGDEKYDLSLYPMWVRRVKK